MKLVAGQDLALEEAAEWSIRLTESPEDADARAQFERWRSASPANAAAWAVMGRTTTALELPALPSRTRSRSRLWAAAGAAMAAALALGAVILPEQLKGLGADFVTGGTARMVTLADGTTAHLAPGTVLDVDYQAGRRAIRLREGEAMFEVRPDARRPFVVSSGEAQTTVLGTGFDVRRAGDGAEVAVSHGKVQVALGGRSVILTAGERAVAQGGRLSTDHLGADLVALWRRGKIVAIDRPVAEVAADLDRRFDGRILLDPRLSERRLSGVYDATDVPAAAEAAAQAVDGRVVRLGNRLITVTVR